MPVSVDHCISWTTVTWNPFGHDDRHSDSFKLGNNDCYLSVSTHSYMNKDIELKLCTNGEMDEPLDLSVQLIIDTVVLHETRRIVRKSGDIIWQTTGNKLKTVFPGYSRAKVHLFKIVVHDNKRIQCTSREKASQADLTPIEPYLEDLSRDFDSLLDNEVDPDVQVHSKDGVIQAHRAILSARSKVFATMFQTDMAEKKTGEVIWHHVDLQTARLFLKFIYSGKSTDFPEEMASALYLLADEYQVWSLRRACGVVMAKNVSGENYTEYLALADRHEDENFKRSLVDFVISHPELMKNEKWATFSASNLKLALEVLQTHVDNFTS